MKILLAADATEATRSAAAQLAALYATFGKAAEIHVLHVCPRSPEPAANGASLGIAERILDDADVPFHSWWVAGDRTEEVRRFIAAHGIDMLMVGERRA
jgi:hypothetical protein